ncbi:MAG TPA: PH domain-containing protein [Balneolaceae bacterium]|nr:PH domain-containing protein [Balneolaceae bacterium]
MRTHFSAPWDTSLKLLTGFFSLILLAVMFYELTLVSVVLILSIFFVCAFWGVRGYTISETELLIRRLGWANRIKLSDIDDIRYEPNIMKGSIRIWGIGGLFGFIGYFRNSRLGNYKAYSTSNKHSVVLDVNGKKIVVSPDSPSEFIEAVQTTQEN